MTSWSATRAVQPRPASSGPPPDASDQHDEPCHHSGQPAADPDTGLDAYIARLAAQAPPLTSEQRDTLALILRRPHGTPASRPVRGRRTRCRNGCIRFMADRRPRDPAQRLDQAVPAQGIQDRYWPDADLAQFAGHQNLTWQIAHLREAGTSLRRFRNRLEALRDGDPPRPCPGCGAPVTGRAGAVCCGTGCRVRAHRTRT